MKRIKVLDRYITTIKQNDEDYLSLTDMLKVKDGSSFISDWLKNRNTVEYLGVWEKIHNPNFKSSKFTKIKSKVGLNTYKISIEEWIAKTNAIGLVSKTGQKGAVFAHKDIAFEFGMWISAEFKIYLIKEFHRLKDEEKKKKYNIKTINNKNYQDEIKVYQLVCLANLKSLNRCFKEEGLSQSARIEKLNEVAINQMQTLLNGKTIMNVTIDERAKIYQLICLSNLETLNVKLIHEGLIQSVRVEKLNKVILNQVELLLNDKTNNIGQQ